MKLEELINWAKSKGIPTSAYLEIAAARYDLVNKRIVFLNTKAVSTALWEVCSMCGCSQAVARQYLDQSNWNILLASIAYKRDHGKSQTETEAETQA